MTTEYKPKRKCAKCGKKIAFYEDYTKPNSESKKYAFQPLCENCAKEENQ